MFVLSELTIYFGQHTHCWLAVWTHKYIVPSNVFPWRFLVLHFYLIFCKVVNTSWLPSKKVPSISCLWIVQQLALVFYRRHMRLKPPIRPWNLCFYTLYINCKSRAEETKAHGKKTGCTATSRQQKKWRRCLQRECSSFPMQTRPL